MLFVSQSEATASAVTWSAYDDTMFFISGFVSEEELLKMAESVQRIIYLPTWIPEGYAEKSVRVFNDKTTVLYVNDSGELVRFSYVITNRDYNWTFDFGQGEILDCRVGDQPGTLFRSHDEKTAGFVSWIGADDTAFYVTGFIGDRNNGKPTVMLEAHIDEIGFIVTYIDDDGFLKVGNCGGTDRSRKVVKAVVAEQLVADLLYRLPARSQTHVVGIDGTLHLSHHLVEGGGLC